MIRSDYEYDYDNTVYIFTYHPGANAEEVRHARNQILFSIVVFKESSELS